MMYNFKPLVLLAALGLTNAFQINLPTSTTTSASRSTNDTPATVQKAVSTDEMWGKLNTMRVQGDTLRTSSLEEGVERVEVLMKSSGRPVHADVELWQGHTNDPQKMKVYLEDGAERSFRAVVECPGSTNSVSIRNIATEEYPLMAGIAADYGGPDSLGSPGDILASVSSSRIVQGGAVYILPFAPEVQSIQVMLKSDGRPMRAKLELLQGPNNVKQSMEVYAEDGNARSIYVILDSPGTGNVVRIVNTATVEYPLEAHMEPYIIDESLVQEATGTNWV